MSAEQQGEVFGQVIGVAIVVLIAFFVIRSTMGKKLQLAPSEYKLAEIWCECKQLKWGGFVLVGNAYTGRLILTNTRLVYANPNSTKMAFGLAPTQIRSVVKGQRGPMMTMDLTYALPNGKIKTASFMQVAAVPGQTIDPRTQLPIGMFIDRVMAWREGQQLPPMGTPGMPGMPGAGMPGPGMTA